MSVPDGPFAPILEIGGTGGSPFTSVGWVQGALALLVIGLDVWYNDQRLRAVQLTFSDASRSIVYGNPSDSHAGIAFQSGEHVSSMTLWGDGIGTRTGRIRLTTNMGNTLDAGKDTSSQTPYDIDIGSGYLVGMLGRSGLDIDLLGAIFLRSPVTRVSISDIVYIPDLADTSLGIAQAPALAHQSFANPATATSNKSWTFGGTTDLTTATTYTQTTGKTYGGSVAVEVSGEVLGVGASVTGTFEWQQQSGETTSTTETYTQTFTWGEGGTLTPGESITCTAIVYKGDADVNYNSTVTVTLQDGTTNVFPESGQFHNVAYSNATVQTSN